MSLPALNYNFMDTLDKYRSIIDKIQEMCTSTVALAPYPVGGVSVTTIRAKQSKGKSSKPMLNYKYTKQWNERSTSIVETMEKLQKLCEEYYLQGKPVSGDEFRAFMEKRKQRAGELKQQLSQKKGSQRVIDDILSTVKKWRDTAKGNKQPLNCNYVSEGRHAKVIDPKLWSKMKNMKYIDPEYYDLSPEQYAKVMKNLKNQEKFKDMIAGAQASGDEAAENIIGGQIKRTQNIARRQTKEARAKIWKSMGKRLQSQIVRDPAKMRKREERRARKNGEQ